MNLQDSGDRNCPFLTKVGNSDLAQASIRSVCLDKKAGIWM